MNILAALPARNRFWPCRMLLPRVVENLSVLGRATMLMGGCCGAYV